MRRYRAYVFDLDGTLYRGDTALADAAETLADLRAGGAAIRFLTNNSTLTRADFASKLQRLGFEAHGSEIHTSATGTAEYLTRSGIATALVTGEPGLVATLREAGIRVLNALGNGIVLPQSQTVPDAVVVGLCRSFDYALLQAAMECIRAGSRFIATNPDVTYPMEGDRLIPGAGSLVAAVCAASGVMPTVIGKPQPFMISAIVSELGLPVEDVLVVGDRADTDIAAGIAAGCPTWLVLTGIEKEPVPGVPFGASLRELL